MPVADIKPDSHGIVFKLGWELRADEWSSTVSQADQATPPKRPLCDRSPARRNQRGPRSWRQENHRPSGRRSNLGRAKRFHCAHRNLGLFLGPEWFCLFPVPSRTASPEMRQSWGVL